MSRNPLDTMGPRIRQKRLVKGWSQQDLADAVNATIWAPNVTQGAISHLEVGRDNVLPSMRLFAALCVALHTSGDYLMGFSDDDTPTLGIAETAYLVAENDKERALLEDFFDELRMIPIEERCKILELLTYTARGILLTRQRGH
jgi:transcriptional regulator with XRE-family HTH domain